MLKKSIFNIQVSQGDTRIASGVVSTVKVLKFHQDKKNSEDISFDEEIILLDLNDVYKILESRGHSYR